MNAARVIQADVGIVGAGPAGMAAAVQLAAHDVMVAVIDEGMQPGGQIFRQLPGGVQPRMRLGEPPSHDFGHELIDAATGARCQWIHRATVWDVKPGAIWFERDGQSWLLRCRHVVLAPGAMDRVLPFPGWTLPGVITAGAAQVMVRGFGVRPGRRALVAGTGPLLLPTVTALAGAGVEIVAALEAAPRRAMWRALPAVLGNAARRREAWFYARALLKSGVRLRWGHALFEVRGDGAVQQAVFGRLDRAGRPIAGSERTVDVDVVCTGYGLVPSVELGALAGCELHWHGARGGYCVRTDERMRTTVPGVYAAGEIAGIGGAEVARLEGELAATSIAVELGLAQPRPLLQAQRERERRAADAMLAAFQVRDGLAALARDDTIVCRCEDVTLAAARAAAALHGTSARAIKIGCRAGMGACQGRICGPNVQGLCGGSLRQWDPPVVQVPAKPVRTATLFDAPQ